MLLGHDVHLTGEVREQLVRDLVVVLGAEALLTLVDLYGLDEESAVASLVGTARRVTAAGLAEKHSNERTNPAIQPPTAE